MSSSHQPSNKLSPLNSSLASVSHAFHFRETMLGLINAVLDKKPEAVSELNKVLVDPHKQLEQAFFIMELIALQDSIITRWMQGENVTHDFQAVSQLANYLTPQCMLGITFEMQDRVATSTAKCINFLCDVVDWHKGYTKFFAHTLTFAQTFLNANNSYYLSMFENSISASCAQAELGKNLLTFLDRQKENIRRQDLDCLESLVPVYDKLFDLITLFDVPQRGKAIYKFMRAVERGYKSTTTIGQDLGPKITAAEYIAKDYFYNAKRKSADKITPKVQSKGALSINPIDEQAVIAQERFNKLYSVLLISAARELSVSSAEQLRPAVWKDLLYRRSAAHPASEYFTQGLAMADKEHVGDLLLALLWSAKNNKELLVNIIALLDVEELWNQHDNISTIYYSTLKRQLGEYVLGVNVYPTSGLQDSNEADAHLGDLIDSLICTQMLTYIETIDFEELARHCYIKTTAENARVLITGLCVRLWPERFRDYDMYP